MLQRMAAAIAEGGGAPLTAGQFKAALAAQYPGEDAKKLEERINKLLRDNPLLTDWPGAALSFRHPQVGAALAAETLTEATLPAAAERPAWQNALPFAAMRLPFDAVLAARTAGNWLGCIGLGALGDPEPIKDLNDMLQDADESVQLAAASALGAIGTEAALETMIGGLLDGEQRLRRAVAEALAAIPGVGHFTLRDAIGSQEMMVRHAAVYGLARVRAAWAVALLYRALLEDEQWYVRNAAEQAFLGAQALDNGGVKRYPEADTLEWLVTWAAGRGEGVPAGPNARQSLIRALQEGDSAHRAAAAIALGDMGYVPALKPLYRALSDRDEKVRAAAYEALGKVSAKMGQRLPAV
jgi:hypothetical protein